MNLKDIKKYKK